MAYIVYVIESADSIAQLKDQVASGGTKALEGCVNARNYFEALLAGAKAGEVQLTVRDTDPNVATSGAGSIQETYDLK